MARPPDVPQSETELEEFFDLSIDPLSIIGFAGEFKRVNASFLHLVGYSKPELVSRTVLDILHPDDFERAREALAKLAEGHDVVRFEGRVICADGSVRWLEWSTRSMPERGVVYCVGRDTTERRRVDAELKALAEEQAALRRVATLVARDVPAGELFGAVSAEVCVLLGADLGGMIRYEEDGTVTAVAAWAAVGEFPPMPERWQIEPGDPAWMLLENRAATRVEDWTSVPGPFAEAVRNYFGVSSSVGCPIWAEGRLWGGLAVHSKQSQLLPPDTEARMAQFTELVGTAIANAETRAEVARLADEQAALRRVATLIARGMGPETVFQAVADEVQALLDTDASGILRFEADGTGVVLGARGAPYGPGARLELDSDFMLDAVRTTGRAARVDTDDPADARVPEGVRAAGLRSAVAHPILVEGGVWGAIAVGSGESPMPAVTEARLAGFTELAATAVANTDAREQVTALAEEQAALRRVATLVAEGAEPAVVFEAVAAETQTLVGADGVSLCRYEPAEHVLVVAHTGANAARVPPGTRVNHEGNTLSSIVRRTERPARLEPFPRPDGATGELIKDFGVRAGVGVPIIVDGRLWGVTAATWLGDASPPQDTEARMSQFAGLLDTAIANADSRDQLTASRARLVTAGDEARRRVVRDLHDGAQQRLVHAIVTLKLAQRAAGDNDGEVESLLGEALEQAEQGNRELRDLAHGILPPALTRGGLRAGVEAVVARLEFPVAIDISAERLPAELEASAYFVVAEGLTNVMKHAHAARAEVKASLADGRLQVEVHDDGIGGADPSGHGLVGMADRVSALGGILSVQSPAGGGTVVTATLPLPAA